MKLTEKEFKAMNDPWRQLLQRRVEFPLFQRLGLAEKNQDILEIGCGSGYGAELLLTLNPASYLGVDLMSEQIALAKKRELPNAVFKVQDASDLVAVSDNSKDVVVVFGVLHHISTWRKVLSECYRVLRTGGKVFIEEPDGKFISAWDRIFKWGHGATFTLKEFEEHVRTLGFTICQRKWLFGLGVYCLEKQLGN